jgi:transcriptional regulator with XRE-family HTH domain
MNSLPLALLDLMDRRGMTQKALAEKVGISPVAMSNIMTGRAKPRQVNLGRIMRELCRTPAEEQMILSAFDHAEARIEADAPDQPEKPVPADEVERVRRYMEIKAASVAFEREVEAALRKTGVSFEKSFSRNGLICDFFLPGPLATAIECKFNVRRDWDREITTARLLREGLPCERVLIVVPESNDLVKAAVTAVAAAGGTIATVEELKGVL